MVGPTYKDEVYIATENEPWEKTRADAKENGYLFFCESNYSSADLAYGLYPIVKDVNTGDPIEGVIRYEDLDERLDPSKPIWDTSDEPVGNEDAWKQYHDLVERFTTKVEVRPDIHVKGLAWDRGVEVIVFSEGGPMNRTWQSTRKRNIDTMRELAKAINDACDFVEINNPKWASRTSIRKDNNLWD